MKNRIPVYHLIVVLALAIYTSASYAAQPRSYPFFCKGGGNMILKLKPDTQQGGTAIQLTFKKGTRAATRGVNAGECTWSDRGMRSNEPRILTFYDRNIDVETRLGPGKNMSLTPYGDNRNQWRPVSKMLNAIQTGQEFQVRAYSYKNRAGRTSLRILKFGP